ncbi:MAG: hypothetical protein DCC49_12990 [Acidobacteria bacterium]|nr:MAG: hypothetical protein DCC49_12990 [Acidobacteriota bacterium]
MAERHPLFQRLDGGLGLVVQLTRHIERRNPAIAWALDSYEAMRANFGENRSMPTNPPLATATRATERRSPVGRRVAQPSKPRDSRPRSYSHRAPTPTSTFIKMPLRPARDTLVGEEDMTGTVREYLYAGGEAPTAMRSRNVDGTYSNFFFVTNTHGDVVALTDKDGNIVNRYAYGPWGEATRVSEQVHQPFRYAGYRYEDGFDLYYLRARWMDPNTGRFLSRDANAGAKSDLRSLNRYIYTLGCPTSFVDPSGYGPCSANAGGPGEWGHTVAWNFRPVIKAVSGMRGMNASFLGAIVWSENRDVEAQGVNQIGSQIVAAAGSSNIDPSVSALSYGIANVQLRNAWALEQGIPVVSDYDGPRTVPDFGDLYGGVTQRNGRPYFSLRYAVGLLEQLKNRRSSAWNGMAWGSLPDAAFIRIASQYNAGEGALDTTYGKETCGRMKILQAGGYD